ncbi:C2H2 type master regulator of conidiophore development brlA [Fusarium oxysporum f. sp. albedinis]|nr:C2H2 type master regulator of conidiophore development brlA [Fusarium oxysporum f. sp. albedinis]
MLGTSTTRKQIEHLEVQMHVLVISIPLTCSVEYNIKSDNTATSKKKSTRGSSTNKDIKNPHNGMHVIP